MVDGEYRRLWSRILEGEGMNVQVLGPDSYKIYEGASFAESMIVEK